MEKIEQDFINEMKYDIMDIKIEFSEMQIGLNNKIKKMYVKLKKIEDELNAKKKHSTQLV